MHGGVQPVIGACELTALVWACLHLHCQFALMCYSCSMARKSKVLFIVFLVHVTIVQLQAKQWWGFFFWGGKGDLHTAVSRCSPTSNGEGSLFC